MWTDDVRQKLIHGTFEEWLEIKKKFEMLGYKIVTYGDKFATIQFPNYITVEYNTGMLNIVLLHILKVIEHDIAEGSNE